MQHLIPLEQLISRAAKLGLTPTQLARAAGVHWTTMSRIVKRGGCRTQTLELLGTALITAERAALDHLRQLHPDQHTGAAA